MDETETETEAEIEASEHDMYVAQLKEVFDSCDQTGSGQLNRQELFSLCDRLQLEDQSAFLVNGLLKDDKEEVGFDEFKDSFVTILCQTTVDEPLSGDESDEEEGSGAESEGPQEGGEGETGQEDDTETSIKREVSPKFVKGSKRYGRKSLPYSSDDFDCLADDEDDTEVRSSTKSLKHSLTVGSITDTEEDGSESQKKRRRRTTSQGSVSEGDELFEAEGQLNLMMADSENLTTEEEYLRGIWNNLGVGSNGYISMTELEQVCRHIGMEEMSPSELQQLFDKLDADGDGRVSFKEFLAELFQHNTPANQHPKAPTPGTPRSLGTTPTRSLSAQKKLKYPVGAEDRTTPSVVQGTGVSGLFSMLDPDRTGFAKPDAIIDLWEKYNVLNGADILLALGFELNTKVNLSELSVLLEQELLGADEQNILLQAATASYQQEMRNVKSSLEQAGWAIEKLKLDLSEANTRNSMLAKEVDERHASMEKSSESKLLSVEKKYGDQIKALQSELDKERENSSSVAAKHQQSLDSEMEELRQEEGKLRDQLLDALKEMERVTRELEQTSERLKESERLNQRYQKELESVEGLHHKLAEYESKGIMSPEEQKFTWEKMLRIELENKELKDQNDELTVELEQVKLQGAPSRKMLEPSSPERGTHPPAREGSVMSHYVRPVVVKRALGSPYDYSDDDTRSPGDSQVLGEQDDEISVGETLDKDTIARLRKEISELKDNFERERKDIEQSYKLEIAAIEAKHDEEKGEILKNIEKDKAKILDDFERLQQEALAELGKELQTKFVHEKEDLIEKYESKLNLREQEYAEEKKQLTQRLAAEYEVDIEAQLNEVKNKYDQDKFQLEEALTELDPYVKDLENKHSDLQTKLDKVKSEKDKEVERLKSEINNLKSENSELKEKLEKQKDEMTKKLKAQRTEMEDLFSRHMQSLEDVEKKKTDSEFKYKKLVSDLELTNREERMELEGEIERLQQDVREIQKQRMSMELELKQQREELELSYRQEKQEIKELYEERIRQLEDSGKQLESDLFKQGVAGLQGKLKEDFNKLLEENKSKQEAEIREAVKREADETERALQAEFEARKSELSHVFEREMEELKEKYEQQIELLRQQLSQLQEQLEEEKELLTQRYENEREAIEDQLAQQIREELEEEICQQMEDIKEAFDDEKREFEAQMNLLKQEVEELQRALEAEDKNRKKLDEVMRANNRLQQEKRTAEKGQVELREALESTKTALESRIDELLSEKEGAITAVKAGVVESAGPPGSQKTVHEAVIMEKQALESRVSRLTQEVVDLQIKADHADRLQETVDKLQDKVSELEVELKHTQSSVPQHVQQVIDDLTKEKSEMEERLVDTEQRLNEFEETGQKFLHLQLDFEQLAFDHSALEETLLETQEKLVDTQQTLDQAEKEIKDLHKYKDRCRHLQKKYDESCKERDKAVSFAKSVKEQLNLANTSNKEDHEDKSRLAGMLEEKKHLEIQLQRVNDKLLESTTNFAVSQSQHVKELQQLKDQTTNMVDLQKYTKLQIELVDSQRSVRDLQEQINNREELVAKKMKESTDQHHQEIKELEEVKESLGRQLKTLQEVLDNQIEKYKEQFEAGEKRNALVVDLYKENADLMQALYHVEEQKKDAITKCYKLEDQCNNLRRMLKKMARVAIT